MVETDERPHLKGAISVSLLRSERADEATIVFADDGVGFRESSDSKRHGFSLVKRLMQQVGGSTELRSDHGSERILRFPVPTISSSDATLEMALWFDWRSHDARTKIARHRRRAFKFDGGTDAGEEMAGPWWINAWGTERAGARTRNRGGPWSAAFVDEHPAASHRLPDQLGIVERRASNDAEERVVAPGDTDRYVPAASDLPSVEDRVRLRASAMRRLL